jgi:hypothetical protein
MPLPADTRRRRIAAPPRAGRAALAVAGVLLALAGSACVHPRAAPRLDSADTNARIAAIKRAARAGNHQAAPQLVDALDDEDPAVRFFAIGALERMAGERFGYDYFDDDPAARRPAVERWRQWLAGQGFATKMTTAAPPPTTAAAAPTTLPAPAAASGSVKGR